jgi:NTP pyrophosphatase (non-canonical NTP hydrolase)
VIRLERNISITKLQEYIKQFDFNPDKKIDYFLKLTEEVGELAETIRKDLRIKDNGNIKGTTEEELCDVLYYVVALANVYEIDLERNFRLKDEMNKIKWNR